MSRKSAESTRDVLIDNVKSTLHDAEALLREAAASSGEKAAELRERALVSLKRTREAVHDAQDAIVTQGRRAARATDDYVHDKPWQAVAAAGVLGLLLGLVIGRR
ncbi:DUF883 family protein [Kerstersia similis]|uniref:DUF883 family protein n=1 Tax=Kerstersia similis TaxID=206505 RepID=UPI0039EEE1F7